ncbi:MAG: hypothetical protein RID91_19035 [Azospirillaceae bacterium]
MSQLPILLGAAAALIACAGVYARLRLQAIGLSALARHRMKSAALDLSEIDRLPPEFRLLVMSVAAELRRPFGPWTTLASAILASIAAGHGAAAQSREGLVRALDSLEPDVRGRVETVLEAGVVALLARSVPFYLLLRLVHWDQRVKQPSPRIDGSALRWFLQLVGGRVSHRAA